MTIVKNSTLHVPGATLYYEVRGSGPILLLIHGGGGDADKLQLIADDLADRYTVVTYDRRGHSRSSLANQTENYRVETHSDDVHRLLAELTDEQAYVFGSSSGAVIALDLGIHHPEQVRVLIPHEPILLQLLVGDELLKAKQFMEYMKVNHRSEVEKLISNLVVSASHPNPSKDVITERLLNNSTYFVEYEIPGILNYSLDLAAMKNALTSTAMHVLPAGGNESREFFAYQCAGLLAEQLGATFVEFPGHHGGYNTVHHKEFAERLHEVLEINK